MTLLLRSSFIERTDRIHRAINLNEDIWGIIFFKNFRELGCHRTLTVHFMNWTPSTSIRIPDRTYSDQKTRTFFENDFQKN